MPNSKTLQLVSGAAVGLAVIFALSLASCGKGEAGTSAAPKTELLPQNMPQNVVDAAHKDAEAQRAQHQPEATEPAGDVK